MVHPDHLVPREIKDTLARLVLSAYLVKEDSRDFLEKRESVVLLDRLGLRVLQENRENVVYRVSWVLLVHQASRLSVEILGLLVPRVNPGRLV
jgi:hypothetical protein